MCNLILAVALSQHLGLVALTQPANYISDCATHFRVADCAMAWAYGVWHARSNS